MAAGGCLQGVRTSKSEVPCGAPRHCSEPGDAAVRGGAVARHAWIYGPRVLVVWAFTQSQGARGLPAPPPCPRPVITAGIARGAFPPLDARELRNLAAGVFPLGRAVLRLAHVGRARVLLLRSAQHRRS